MPRKETPSSLPESSGVPEAETPPSATGGAESAPAPTPAEPTESAAPVQSDGSAPNGDCSTSPTSAPLTPLEPETPPAESPVMAALRRKAEQEAENAAGATKGRHPYEYEVADPARVPEAFRDEQYAVSEQLIEEHLQSAWEHGRGPLIAGLMIGRREP